MKNYCPTEKETEKEVSCWKINEDCVARIRSCNEKRFHIHLSYRFEKMHILLCEQYFEERNENQIYDWVRISYTVGPNGIRNVLV